MYNQFVSLFHKLENLDNIEIIHSIAENIKTIISNRSDVYWAYDTKNNKAIPVHHVFALDFYSVEFQKEFAKVLEVCDARLSEIKVEVIKEEQSVKIVVKGFFSQGADKNLLPDLLFDI